MKLKKPKVPFYIWPLSMAVGFFWLAFNSASLSVLLYGYLALFGAAWTYNDEKKEKAKLKTKNLNLTQLP